LEALVGAGFVVYYVDNSTTPETIYYGIFSGSDGSYTLTGWTTDETQATEVFTGSAGTVAVAGLDADSDIIYYFKETTAPDGYSLNPDAVTVSFEEVTGGVTSIQTATVSMNDTKLASLPSTGGLGTYLFTIVGVVVMAVMASLYFIKRRRDASDN